MATLEIHLGANRQLTGQPKSAPASLIAKLDLLSGDKETQKHSSREFVLSPVQASTFDDLEPGNWEVSVMSPSGRIIAKEVEVSSVKAATLRIDLRDKDFRKFGRKVATSTPEEPMHPRAMARGNRLAAFQLRSVLKPPRTPDTPRIACLQSRAVMPNMTPDTIIRKWRAIADGVEGKSSIELALSAQLASAPSLTAEPGVWALNDSDPEKRTWLVASSGPYRRLHVAPVPWNSPADRGGVSFVTHGRGSDFSSEIVLLDPDYSGLLAYLSQGAVNDAAALLWQSQEQAGGLLPDYATSATDILWSKRSSPLGAAAAAYVLIGSQDLSEKRPWHDWVGNLCQEFAWIPDGAILLARLRLLQAKTDEDGQDVLRLLNNALRRGLPYYTVGWSWMLRSFAHFPDDPIIKQARPLVERLSAALDMEEPFTTLQLSDEQ